VTRLPQGGSLHPEFYASTFSLGEKVAEVRGRMRGLVNPQLSIGSYRPHEKAADLKSRSALRVLLAGSQTSCPVSAPPAGKSNPQKGKL